MADTGILTGQYVRIEQAVASVGDRILAQLIDWGVVYSYLIMAIWIESELKIEIPWVIILTLLVWLFYTPFMEVMNKGQTLGKMVMKMRVVKADGSRPSLGAYIMRWMLFLVDGPMTSFMGLIPMIMTKSNQRLGDLAAGTVVVKLQNYKKIQVSLDEYDYLMKNYTPRYVQAADLSLEQIEIIRRTLLQTEESANYYRLGQLSEKVQQKLAINRAEPNDEQFLRRILRDYQYYAIEEI
jgi:uncharacterized RDD family membrane protein YckC